MNLQTTKRIIFKNLTKIELSEILFSSKIEINKQNLILIIFLKVLKIINYLQNLHQDGRSRSMMILKYKIDWKRKF